MRNVLRHVLWRLGTSVLVLLGVSMLIFAIARVIPGDPARVALGPNASAEAVARLRDELRLDEPIVVQYLAYMGGLLRGDLGVSLYTNRPVAVDVAQFLPATLELILVAGVLMVALGLPLGIIAARHQGRWPDHLVRVIALLGVSAPGFVWAIVLMLVFSFYLGWFPIEGRIHEDHEALPRLTGFLTIDAALQRDWGAFASAWRHLALPALALALSGIGQAARLTRANMIETYELPYIEMARAYGFPEGRIARRYAFKPSLSPSLTIIGLDFAAMLGNAFLVEAVFGWPGLSRYGVQVILRKDLNAIVGTVLIIATLFILVNIVVDLLTTLLNPRIRYAPGGRA
jgi:peptide/nickel transport system permease protein